MAESESLSFYIDEHLKEGFYASLLFRGEEVKMLPFWVEVKCSREDVLRGFQNIARFCEIFQRKYIETSSNKPRMFFCISFLHPHNALKHRFRLKLISENKL